MDVTVTLKLNTLVDKKSHLLMSPQPFLEIIVADKGRCFDCFWIIFEHYIGLDLP